jgi:3-methyladenine DNA glycosylase AlkD
VEEVLDCLHAKSSKKFLEEMGSRYGIHTDKAMGVPMSAVLKLAKEVGGNHELAAALWKTGWYEARTVAALIEEPGRVSSAQMDRWCRDFDNWAICDTVCFKLFDRTAHAFEKVGQWAERKEEFVKRAAFALLASLALHDKSADDAKFLNCFPLIERASADDRNFVKKGVSWALRSIGRRNADLYKATVDLAEHLNTSGNGAARWIARDVLKDLTRATVKSRAQAKKARATAR